MCARRAILRMVGSGRAVIACGALVASGLVVPHSSHAAHQPGLIAYEALSGGIFTIGADGTGNRRSCPTGTIPLGLPTVLACYTKPHTESSGCGQRDRTARTLALSSARKTPIPDCRRTSTARGTAHGRTPVDASRLSRYLRTGTNARSALSTRSLRTGPGCAGCAAATSPSGWLAIGASRSLLRNGRVRGRVRARPTTASFRYVAMVAVSACWLAPPRPTGATSTSRRTVTGWPLSNRHATCRVWFASWTSERADPNHPLDD